MFAGFAKQAAGLRKTAALPRALLRSDCGGLRSLPASGETHAASCTAAHVRSLSRNFPVACGPASTFARPFARSRRRSRHHHPARPSRRLRGSSRTATHTALETGIETAWGDLAGRTCRQQSDPFPSMGDVDFLLADDAMIDPASIFEGAFKRPDRRTVAEEPPACTDEGSGPRSSRPFMFLAGSGVYTMEDVERARIIADLLTPISSALAGGRASANGRRSWKRKPASRGGPPLGALKLTEALSRSVSHRAWTCTTSTLAEPDASRPQD